MRKIATVCLVLLLVGCVGAEIKAPETMEEKLNYASATLTGLTYLVIENLKTGYTTVEDAEVFQAQATEIRDMLVVARASLALKDDATALTNYREIHALLLLMNQRFNNYSGGIE